MTMSARLLFAQVDEALNAYKLILDEDEEVPESISNFVTSRKKNLSIINVAKQMDTKKQEAKAVAARAEQASVSTEFRMKLLIDQVKHK